MRRREFMIGAAAAVGISRPTLLRAQPTKIYKLGMLTPGLPMEATNGRGAILINAVAQRGYKLGQNLTFEARGARGKSQQLPALMQELKAAKVSVVVTLGYPPVVAAKASGVPTVIASGSGDPVETGLIESLARPGGNVTGIADNPATLSTKRLSLLKALLPQLKRAAMLWNKDDLGMTLRYKASATAAQAMGVDVQPLGVGEPDDFDDAFSAMKRDMPEAILMVSDSLTLLNRKRVIDFAAEHRLPAIYETDDIVREGGLMSYGADQHESLVRVAALVDAIFKGAKPADLPIEQPTRYLFVLNLKTAKQMNLAVPNTVAALADEVVE